MSNLSNSLPHRGLTLRQTAAYWGVCPNTLRKWVREGVVPGPLEIPGLGRGLFDREQQERAFNAYVRTTAPRRLNGMAGHHD